MTRPDARPNGRFRDDLVTAGIIVVLFFGMTTAANLLIEWIGL